jgi:hypothetical protein
MKRTFLAAVVAAALWPASALAEYKPGIPPAVDPGTPVFAGAQDPVPGEPAPLQPGKSRLEAIYEADLAAGGTSFWIDRVLERPFLSNQDSALYTRGRALYMYTHSPGTLGFAGGYAYRERPTGSNQSLYTLAISGATLSEATAQRRQYPSHWESTHTATGLSVEQRKFITQNNVAVTVLKLTNTGTEPTTRTLTLSSPVATIPAALGTELTGSVKARWGLTVVTPRLSGDGFGVSGSALTRTVSLDPGEAVTLKAQMGMIAAELPASQSEYERYADYDPETAYRTQLREYNRWWVDNVPYIDIPDANVKKMSYYRTFLNRYNMFDGNIPGNDYQWPVSIEGVLGYNNAITVSQPMHEQDLKYFRDPVYAYGDWVSAGETSKCAAFTDNPGNALNWNNDLEQYLGAEAWQSYLVHGGEPAILRNLAHYIECDVRGWLAKFDANHNDLMEWASGFYTGNDSDAVALVYFNTPGTGRNAIGRAQDRTETAFWYSGARAAESIYALLGDDAKRDELHALAERLKTAVLGLWDPVEKVFKQRDVETGTAIPWKDQQNFSPFTEGVAPDTDDYKQALRFFADKAEFPIMPSYTADQADKAAARAAGKPGSNNFSNINLTLQARLFGKALRDYPSPYVTPDSYRKLLEWGAWTEYVNGDNRYPDNNEYFSNWNPDTKTFTRSSIHHNILGAFNFMLIDGIAGVTPRADDTLELRPIDVGYDHYAIDNLRYHGSDLTLVWDKPGDGKAYYPGMPEGMTAYVDGHRAFTVDDLLRVTWDSRTGAVTSDAHTLYAAARPLTTATGTRLAGNARVADMFQKAGVELGSSLANLAAGRPASASYTAPETSAANAVDGWTLSGPTVTPGSYVMTPSFAVYNPIWGTKGSPNAQDWLELDLGAPRRFDIAKIYFYSNKEFAAGPVPQGPAVEGDTYREPAAYSVQFLDGGGRWVDASAPAPGAPNFNRVDFAPVTAQHVRVLLTPTPGYAIGVKELQLYDSGSAVTVPVTVGGMVPPTLSLSLGPPASFGAFTPGVEHTYEAGTTANVVSTAGDAALTVSDPGHLANGAFSLPDPLRVTLSKTSWSAPVSNDTVAIAFTQHIGANDALRTGRYSKTVTFTLATTTP